MKLVVTIPAHDEEKTIAGVIKEIPRYIEGIDSVEVVLVDYASCDNTAVNAIKAGASEIVTHVVNKGLGVTFREGLDLALERGEIS